LASAVLTSKKKPMKLRQVGRVKIAPGRVVLNQPAVTERAIFTGYPMTVTIGLDKGSLEPIWRKKVGVTFKGVSAGVLAFWRGVEFQGWDTGGKVLWTRSFGVDPYVDGRRLLFLESGMMQVVDGTTGETIEEFPCPDGWPALLQDEILFIKHPDKSVPFRAFHLSERRVCWERDLQGELEGRCETPGAQVSAVARGGPGRFVATTAGHIASFSVANGECRWHARIHVPYYWPQVCDGRIYVWTTVPLPDARVRTTLDLDRRVMIQERPGDLGAENRLLIVEEESGNVLVDRALAQYGLEFTGRLEPWRGTLCSSHIVFTTDTGLLAVFSLSDGQLTCFHQHRDELFPGVYDGGRLYFSCADGTLVVFEGEGGEL
jgi:outer membrane protein assembly factor BamB